MQHPHSVWVSHCLFSVCAAGYEGTASPGRGCIRCRAGRFKATAGDAACVDCPAGQISAAAGATSCDDCPEDQFSIARQSACSPCYTPGETTDGLTGQPACGENQT